MERSAEDKQLIKQTIKDLQGNECGVSARTQGQKVLCVEQKRHLGDHFGYSIEGGRRVGYSWARRGKAFQWTAHQKKRR